MKKYVITINGYKFKFKLLISYNYTLENLRNNSYLINELLLKNFRNYVLSKNMQKSVLYKHDYIISYESI